MTIEGLFSKTCHLTTLALSFNVETYTYSTVINNAPMARLDSEAYNQLAAPTVKLKTTFFSLRKLKATYSQSHNQPK